MIVTLITLSLCCAPCSVQEREEKIKTVEDLLKMGMIEVANKEEELTVSRGQGSGISLTHLTSLFWSLFRQILF